MVLYQKQIKVIRKDLIFNEEVEDITDWISEEEAIPIFDKYTSIFKDASRNVILMKERYIPFDIDKFYFLRH